MASEDVDADDGGLVFVSYSHEDAAWVQRFAVLLKPLVRRKRLRLWADTAIRIGDHWHPEIEQAIARSRVALLLVSADFLASDYVMDEELPALLRHGVRLAPVLVGDCYWQEVPELAAVQWLHDPGRDGALDLDADRVGQRDRRIRQLCDRLIDIAPGSTFNAASPGIEFPPKVVAAVPVGDVAGYLSEVPVLPPGYVVRDELDEIVDAVVAAELGGAVGLTAEPSGVGLHGLGGIGKSVLAAALARDDRIKYRFPEGVYWVTVGERPDLRAVQLDLLSRLGGDVEALRTVSEATEVLQGVLADRAVLVIVDDVWSDAAAHAFRITGPRGRLLYTSRDEGVITTVGAVPYWVRVLSPETARSLAAAVLRVPVPTLPASADRAFTEVRWVPLAVALLAAAVRGGRRSWDEVGADLDRNLDVYGDHPYANTFRAMQIGTSVLPRELQAALFGLAVFPPDTAIPVAAVVRYWTHTRGLTAEHVAVDLNRLAAANVLSHDGGSVGFHDLQHDYLLLHAPTLAVLHAELLDAYRVLVPPHTGSDQWWRLPPGEPYIWEHLIGHLASAGDRRVLAETVVDPAFQAQRITTGGSHAGEADLVLAARHLTEDRLVRWWQGWLARYQHLFMGRRAPEQASRERGWRIASTLLAWLNADPHRPVEVRQERLVSLLSQPYLAVRSGLDTAPSTLLRVLAGHTDSVNAVAYSPDGTRLATASDDMTVRLWDPTTGQTTMTLTGHTDRVHAVAYSPDGTRLATASDDATVRLWDPTTGKMILTLRGHTGWVRTLAFSPDGTRLATGGDDATVRLWDLTTGQTTMTLTGHTNRVPALAFSPDGTRLATGSDDATVRLWDPTTGQTTMTLTGHTASVCAVAYSRDGTHLATASDDMSVRLWDPTTGQTTMTLTGHTASVCAVAHSPDGTYLATVSNDATVRLWDPTTGQTNSTLTGHTASVCAVAHSPDGTHLATGGDDMSVRLWDPTTGQTASTLTGSHTDWVYGVAFSPDGTRLATGGGDATVRLWDPTTGQTTMTLTGHTDRVHAVAYSPDGTRLATASDDMTVRLWDPTTGKMILTLRGHTGWVRTLAFSPDGTRLATGGDDATVRLWDPTTGQTTITLTGRTDRVPALAFSPDGTRLATGSDDGTVRLWDPITGRITATLTGHSHWVLGITFSPDGTRLATASGDEVVPELVELEVAVPHLKPASR